MWGFSSNPKKCANLTCTCLAEEKKKYCSDHCEKIGNRMEVICLCGHADCGVTVMREASTGREFDARSQTGGPTARL
jgi:hypothetical protein